MRSNAEIIKELRLIDDIFFNVCFDNNPKDVEYILRIILDKPFLRVLEVSTQKEVENIYGRSVRFDVFATDDKGKFYNIEVQRKDTGATPKRARYNSAMIDFRRLEKGAEFDDLTESYVIFITEHDVIGDDLPIYHIERIVLETGKNFGDGTHLIYVNGAYKDDSNSPLGDLIHDFLESDPAKMRHRQLAKTATLAKSFASGGSSMSSVLDGFREECVKEGIKEGIKKGSQNALIDSVRNLMRNMKLTVEQAMEVLEIPAGQQKELAALIKE